ncbi:alpha/beta fold hydrolase [Thalassobacillus sp. CUG 92003]|uniref:alpha/beta fold hydrolase n=1 Tax=Thalassobacillus sp. CUG 92003 TaxID=2736641 RepID=UPI0015E642D7|nr:alpha/beta fold hydrolase [Thalassobacillus sp. CUG 92003]
MILHTKTIGAGEPILFLHTGLQTGETDFLEQQAYFKESYQVVVPDLRGHGQSTSDELNNFLSDSVKDVHETLEALELPRVHVVGCSLGGMVALQFARAYPAQVKSVTLSGITAEKPHDWLALHEEDVAHQQQLLQDEKMVAYMNQLHRGTNWRIFLDLAQDPDWYPFNETEDISDLEPPVFFLVGEAQTGEVASASIYQKQLPHIHVGIVPFAGHNVHLEQTEMYTRLLEHFFNSLEE